MEGALDHGFGRGPPCGWLSMRPISGVSGDGWLVGGTLASRERSIAGWVSTALSQEVLGGVERRAGGAVRRGTLLGPEGTSIPCWIGVTLVAKIVVGQPSHRTASAGSSGLVVVRGGYGG